MMDEEIEKYDPAKPVCDNQGDFNVAFRKALRSNEKENMKKLGNWVYVYVLLWILFLFWAVCLALKCTKEGPERVLHVSLAILLGPVYIISYYLNQMNPSTIRT